MGYSPLGSPGTTWLKGDVLKNPVLVMAPEKLGKTPAQVALRRGLQMGHNVLPKSSTESRIKENLEVYDWSIPEDLFSLKSHGMHLIASKQSDSTRETEHKECAMINQALRWHRQTNICPEQIDLDTVNQSIMKSIRSLIISLRTLLSTSSPSFLLKMP